MTNHNLTLLLVGAVSSLAFYAIGFHQGRLLSVAKRNKSEYDRGYMDRMIESWRKDQSKRDAKTGQWTKKPSLTK